MFRLLVPVLLLVAITEVVYGFGIPYTGFASCGAGGTCPSGFTCSGGNWCLGQGICDPGEYNVVNYQMCARDCSTQPCAPGEICHRNGCSSSLCDPSSEISIMMGTACAYCPGTTVLSGSGCVAAPTCNDGIQNQGELGIDCGGPCPVCLPPPTTCSDGIQNQGEDGIDCGGPCPACPDCNDGIQNQGETGIDCGGPCAACPPPECFNTIQDNGETGIDCGGLCHSCSPGSTLLGSNNAPTCTDGVQNGLELGIDCGGTCPNTCPSGGVTVVNGDLGIIQAQIIPYCPPGLRNPDLTCSCHEPFVTDPLTHSCNCPKNSVYFNGGCVCVWGATKINDQCIPTSPSECGENMLRNAEGNCICADAAMIRTARGCAYCPATLHKGPGEYCLCPTTNLEPREGGCPFGEEQYRDDTTQFIYCKDVNKIISKTNPLECDCQEGYVTVPGSKECVLNEQVGTPETKVEETPALEDPNVNCFCPLCKNEFSTSCVGFVCAPDSAPCQHKIQTKKVRRSGSEIGEEGTSIWAKAYLESPQRILESTKDRELTPGERGKLAVSYVGSWIAKAVATALDVEGHKTGGVEKIERMVAQRNQLESQKAVQKNEDHITLTTSAVN